MKSFASIAIVFLSCTVGAASGFHLPQSATTTNSASKLSMSISPSSISSLLIRGGAAAAAAEPVLQNYYGDALGFFGGIRIPASFLAGSSLAAMFIFKTKADDGELPKLERRVLGFYHLNSLLAFLLSLNTIATATVAHTAVLHGRFDKMAETAYMLMRREFGYEFITVRWSFLCSLFCFLGMIASRLLIEFDLLKKGINDGDTKNKRDIGLLVVCSLGALATHLLSYVNQNLWCWHSLIGMTIYLGKIIIKRAFVEARPLQIVSVGLTAASAFYVTKLGLREMRGETEDVTS
eukprot:CAMPEP_0201724568 /NCGR_PEP_ID=MMETSP0593-20130828/8287_1 /ASSEMBLY_ACC=CAM_ASM_000672 /TAXON_ID=267983 /ORGANISM="Skeletonema japonicum, Strain CCMP2506" /LENGTH=292 /DNA_ID=CAMNT_0048215857 /DNA_START=152 /DNA_END=1030 /DNA_ORIENTATION=-